MLVTVQRTSLCHSPQTRIKSRRSVRPYSEDAQLSGVRDQNRAKELGRSLEIDVTNLNLVTGIHLNRFGYQRVTGCRSRLVPVAQMALFWLVHEILVRQNATISSHL